MSYITLNKSHYFYNLELIQHQVGSKEKIAVVLKDNAYGHGLSEMAHMAHEFGISHAVVRTCSEAARISNYFQTILVLADDAQTAAPVNAHIAINDIAQIEKLASQTSVELKVDSGMHRSGISPEELSLAFERINARQLKLKGVFTHHRSADILSSEYFWQEKTFAAVKTEVGKLLEKYAMPAVRFHSQNSAATFRTQTSGDIVRVGIASYGLLQMPSSLLAVTLKPVLSLWAEKIHTAKSHTHFKHGYEGVGRISESKNVSTYDIGYADGLLRLQDEQRFTMPDGTHLIGRVSMDNIIADHDREKLCIYDDANSYAKAAQTISYEVTTRLAPHIKRTII